MMIKTARLFVTATDTGVGKTTIARWLIPILAARGLHLRIRKPVESGCKSEAGDLLPQDAINLAQASAQTESINTICPYRFKQFASPARAAQLASVSLKISQLADVCKSELLENNDTFLLVEGAGGFYSPIALDGLNADLAEALNLPVLIVVPDCLGCLNHALLTLEAAGSRNLEVIALVLNQLKPVGNQDTDNLTELSDLTTTPVIQTVFDPDGVKNRLAITHIADLINKHSVGHE